MYTVNKQEAKQKEFVLVRNRQTLEINKVLAPHELQVGLEGYKDSSLRVLGDEYIAGSLEIKSGARGTLKLPDGTLAILSDSGIKVSETPNDTVTLSLGTASGGIETLILAGAGLESTVSNGILTLALTESLQPLTLLAGDGISLTSVSGTVTINSTATPVAAGSGLIGTLGGDILTMSLDTTGLALLSGATFTGDVTTQGEFFGSLTRLSDGTTPYLKAGSGITIVTGANGQVEISSNGISSMATELVLNGSVSGIQDGSNTVFTLPHVPSNASSFMLWLNGQLLTRDSDYVLSSNTVTFISQAAPQTEDVIRAMYPRTISQVAYALSQAPASIVLSGSSLAGITMLHEPDPPGSLMLFLNGQLLTQGIGQDYTLTGSNVTFQELFESTDVVQLTYSYNS